MGSWRPGGTHRQGARTWPAAASVPKFPQKLPALAAPAPLLPLTVAAGRGLRGSLLQAAV